MTAINQSVLRVFFFIIPIAGVALACEPAYHANRGVFLGDCEGYSDIRLDSNTFSISICGGYSVSSSELYELYRAAEVTINNHFDSFIILERPAIAHASPSREYFRPITIRAFKGGGIDTIRSLDAHRLLVTMAPYIIRK